MKPESVDQSSVARLSKAALAAAAALWVLLAAFDNVVDYDSNFQFVRHVLEMDSTFPGNAGLSRAIHAPILHHAAYVLIITVEFAVAILSGFGAIRMALAHADPARFRRARVPAIAGLTLGILLWLVGFEVIAGEWFMMWQSRIWNAQESAFRFVAALGVILVFISLE